MIRRRTRKKKKEVGDGGRKRRGGESEAGDPDKGQIKAGLEGRRESWGFILNTVLKFYQASFKR